MPCGWLMFLMAICVRSFNLSSHSHPHSHPSLPASGLFSISLLQHERCPQLVASAELPPIRAPQSIWKRKGPGSSPAARHRWLHLRLHTHQRLRRYPQSSLRVLRPDFTGYGNLPRSCFRSYTPIESSVCCLALGFTNTRCLTNHRAFEPEFGRRNIFTAASNRVTETTSHVEGQQDQVHALFLEPRASAGATAQAFCTLRGRW